MQSGGKVAVFFIQVDITLFYNRQKTSARISRAMKKTAASVASTISGKIEKL